MNVEELTIDQIVKRLESSSQKRFNLSAIELMSKIRLDEMDWGEAGDLVILASLLPIDHQLYMHG